MASNVTRNPSYLTRPLIIDSSSANQLKVLYNALNYTVIDVASDGHLEFATTGSDADITFDSDRSIILEPGTGVSNVTINKDVSGALASDSRGLFIDFDRTVAGSGTAAHNDIGIDLDVTSASLGTSSVIGMDIDVTGATSGVYTATGLDISVTGADINYALITAGGNVGIGVADPDSVLEIFGTSRQLKLSYDASNYANLDVASDGHLTLSTTGTDADITLDSASDIFLDAGGGACRLIDDGGTFTPVHASDITTKAYVDTVVNAPCMPVFFNERTASRTYFRNADDAFNVWEWDGYDTEDSTTGGDTITITTGNLYSGYLVPVDCTLIGARWNLYQSYNVSSNIHAQIWTADPEAGTTATLRISTSYTANRVFAGGDTVSVAVDLDAGDMIIPAFQWVNGANSTWYGAVTFKLKRR